MKRRIATLALVLSLLLTLETSGLMAQNTSSVYQTAKRPRARALIGDLYHGPTYIRDGPTPAFLRENIPVIFNESVGALKRRVRSKIFSCSSFFATG
jgi:hypothetical protein